MTTPTYAAVIFGNTGLANGSRWDAAARDIAGNERSLADGLRFSVQGGGYQAYRDLFTWQGEPPSVPDFTNAIDQAFAAWTVTDPATGLAADLAFTQDLATPVAGPSSNKGVNTDGAEIDLLAETDGVFWDPADPNPQGETFFSTTAFTTLTLTSGVSYPGFAISGADIKLNANPQAQWDLATFQTVLIHEIGHAIGLGDVDAPGNLGRFIDDNYDPTDPATALATLTNPWADLVDPFEPAASPLAEFTVDNADPGLLTPGVTPFMASTFLADHLGDPTPLTNDEFGGRQFLYPYAANFPGDLDADRFVGINDLNLLLANWNQLVPPADLTADPSADGFVGIDDLNIVLANWNTGFPPTAGPANAIPTPAVVSLWLGLGPVCLRRR